MRQTQDPRGDIVPNANSAPSRPPFPTLQELAGWFEKMREGEIEVVRAGVLELERYMAPLPANDLRRLLPLALVTKGYQRDGRLAARDEAHREVIRVTQLPPLDTVGLARWRHIRMAVNRALREGGETIGTTRLRLERERDTNPSDPRTQRALIEGIEKLAAEESRPCPEDEDPR